MKSPKKYKVGEEYKVGERIMYEGRIYRVVRILYGVPDLEQEEMVVFI